MAWATRLEDCKDAADYAYCTCAVYSCGYSQPNRANLSFESLRGGWAETDCSYGVATWLYWGGILDELYGFWTAIEIDYLTGKGFTKLNPNTTSPERNDVLWRAKHTALYIGDGKQAEALRTERHDAGYDGSIPGDQDDGETVVRDYPAGGWTWILRPPRQEKPAAVPKQVAGKPKNSLGMNYRGHVQDAGWLDPVHDGQNAGTTGQSARLEALKITPPEGMELTVIAHMEDVGDKTYKGVRRGKSSGTGSSKTDPIIGTTGKSRRLEAIKIIVTKRPASLKGYHVMVQAHVEDEGWQEPVPEGKWAGTRGKSLRMEAVRIWLEKA